MSQNSTARRFFHFFRLLLLSIVTVFGGCSDSNGEFVYTSPNNQNPIVVTANKLTVTPDVSAAVTPRVIATAASFRVRVYDQNGALVSEQTVARGQSAVFTDLPDGLYLVRTEGLDQNGAFIGYFDRSLQITDDVTVPVPGLIYASAAPSGTTPNTATDAVASIIFSNLPDSLTGGAIFALTVNAYDASGQPFTGATGSVTVTVSGVAGSTFPSQNFTNGVATFTKLQLPLSSHGLAVFTANGAGLTAMTPPIPVSAGQLLEPAVPLADTFLTIFPVIETERPDGYTYFPGYAHFWDLDQTFQISDGIRDSYDGANALFVTAEGGSPERFGGTTPVTTSELEWLTPLFGEADGLVAARVVLPSANFSGDASNVCQLAPGKENRVQQQLDLSTATGTITASWDDRLLLDVQGSLNVEQQQYRVVVRSVSGDILATLFNRTDYGDIPSTTRTADLTGFAGQTVVLSFELLNSQGDYIFNGFYFDEVSVKDGNGTQFVTNGTFDTGDLSGWTTYVTPLSQHVRTTTRTLAGVTVRRTVYAAAGTNWIRYFDEFTNPGSSDVTIGVQLNINLGSDGNETVYQGTGGTVASSDNGTSDDDLGFVFGTGATIGGGTGQGYLTADYSLTIPAGQTRSLVSFLAQDNHSSAGAEPTTLLTQMEGIAANFVNDAALVRGLTQAEYDSIVNF